MPLSWKLLILAVAGAAIWLVLWGTEESGVAGEPRIVSRSADARSTRDLDSPGAPVSNASATEERVAGASGDRQAMPGPVSTLQATPEAAGVHGRVVDELGAPVGQAFVFAHRVVAGDLEPSSRAVVRTDEAGRFVVSLDTDGPHAVFAVTAQSLPAAAQLDVHPGMHQELQEDLVLIAGATIRGHAVGAGAALPKARLRARLEANDQGWQPAQAILGGELGFAHFAWDGTCLVRDEASVQADDLGEFELFGLEPERYVLECDPTLTEAPMAVFSLGNPAYRETEQVVEAPASGVLVHDGMAGIVLDLDAYAEPTAGNAPKKTASGEIHLGLRRGADSVREATLSVPLGGEARVRLPPYSALDLRTRFVGFAPYEVSLLAPGPGEVSRVLVPRTEAGVASSLVFRTDPDAAPALMDVKLWKKDEERGSTHRRVSVAFGRADLGEVDPGSYRVRIEDSSGEGTWLPWEGDVALAAGQALEQWINLAAGARLHVGVKDFDGAFVSAAVTLDVLGDRGERRRKQVTFEMETSEGWLAQADEMIPGLGIASIREVLVPGRYELTARYANCPEKRTTIELAPGETQTLVLQLERR